MENQKCKNDIKKKRKKGIDLLQLHHVWQKLYYVIYDII